MRAIILAAGRGGRMRPYTEDRPKCLVELRGRSLLDRQVSALRGGGVDEIGVVTGWRGEAFAGTGLRTFENPLWARSTMVESLAAAAEWLAEEPVIVSYGDIVFSAATVRDLVRSTAGIAVAYDTEWESVWRQRFEEPLSDAETFQVDADGLLTDIGSRPDSLAQVRGQYMGLVRLTPTAWEVLRETRAASEENAALDMTGLLGLVTRTGRLRIAAVPNTGPWWEFDSPSDVDAGLPVLDRLDAEQEGG
ncbi:phosphocholine cytidylyltransferase family protein [Umezawaea endophytica]|uniref:Phosphocholine cytidylyltransferase family protein n=1 Tax=Umezawaea endophytica TaxID=1654476 RepID=A0A9X2VKV0_9PSEU|nr:phosphocholine cytidylyltransferase family protein [Umezawaea endophytica]MCS7477023.1 phosphocholine cytidylyltransferase family protein [Umezawaea endophytica]